MTLKLYADLLGQPSRALHIFLKTCEIPFELVNIQLLKGEQFSEEFAKINPMRKVPSIDDNGFFLSESVAIVRYLARENKVADHWYPTDSEKQARVDEYLEWQHLNTRILCMTFFRKKFLEPMLSNTPADEVKVAQHFEDMLKCLNQMESIWLDGGKKQFVAGDEISVADLFALCELEQPGMAGYDVFVKHPILGEWRERVKKLVGSHYEEAHQTVRNLTAQYNGVPPIKQ